MVVMALVIAFLPNCQKEDPFDKAALDDFLKSLQPISDVMPVEKDRTEVSTQADTTSEYINHTTVYEAAAGFNEQIVLNPQTDVIYPGALVKGESILDGTYTLIPAARKPITISTSLTGASKVSVVVDDPKLSTVREAVNTLMSQTYDVPAANMGFTIEQAYSEQQLDLSLRASYKSGVVNVKGGFDFSNTKIKTRLVAKFIQNYYTLDMDMPNLPSDLFDGDVDRTLFGTFMPMYVSSVTFGRMALFTIESELEESMVRAALDVSYTSINAETSAEFNAFKSKSTMKVYILGGSGSDAGATINGFEDFKNYIKAGGNFSKTSPGAPIAYKLRYIKDNTIGKIVLAASYPIVSSIPRTDNIVYDIETYLWKIRTSVTDAGSECELYGTVTSYPESLGFSNGHKHWNYSSGSYYTMPASNADGRVLTENEKTVKLWEGLKQDSAIMVYISLAEVDDWPASDDKYDKLNFTTTVAEIATGVSPGTPYYQPAAFRVNDTGRSNEFVEFTFRFTPTMRRLDK
jgi:thiol-activated cytolysin